MGRLVCCCSEPMICGSPVAEILCQKFHSSLRLTFSCVILTAVRILNTFRVIRKRLACVQPHSPQPNVSELPGFLGQESLRMIICFKSSPGECACVSFSCDRGSSHLRIVGDILLGWQSSPMEVVSLFWKFTLSRIYIRMSLVASNLQGCSVESHSVRKVRSSLALPCNQLHS